jgi:hypothetical protein
LEQEEAMRIIVVGALALVAGCATTPGWNAQAKQLVATHQCEAARSVVRANESDLGTQAGYIGAIYADCDHVMPSAYKFWTLSARYGNAWAQQTLARLGQPVPSADLRQARSPSAAESFMRGYNQGGSRFPDTGSVSSGAVHCDTRQTTMGQGMNKGYDVTCR